MKRSYNLYQPGALIRDFYDGSAAYYNSKDINWSPFSKVGSLAGMADEPRPRTVQNVRRSPMRTPIFPTGFSLQGVTGSEAVVTPAEMAAPEQEPLHERVILALAAGLALAAAPFVALWRQVARMRFLPKKYSLERGVYTDYSGNAFAFAKISLATMAVLLAVLWGVLGSSTYPTVPAPVLHPGATRQITASTPALPVNNVQTTPPSSSSGAVSAVRSHALTSDNTSVPSMTVAQPVGGMGGGPTDTALPTTPVTLPTPTDPVPTQPIDTTPVIPPVTIPGVTVQAGDTTLLSTPPVSLGL